MSDPSALRFAIKESNASIPYFCIFPKLGKEYLKLLQNLWASAEEKVKIVCFLSIRKLAIQQPSPYLDLALKASYLTFRQTCRITNAHTLPTISFMMNCLGELYGLRSSTSYQFAFVYIRQLAMSLRAATTAKTAESFKNLYHWPFVHCIKLWATIIGEFCKAGGEGEKIMRPLIYPLVQIALGAIRIKPSIKYFPFRLYILKAMMDLMHSTGTFIPLTSYLFDVLDSSEMTGRPKPSTQKPINMTLLLKLPNPFMGSKACQDQLLEETLNLFLGYYSRLSCHIGFPELAVTAVIRLKRLLKHIKTPSTKRQVQGLIEKVMFPLAHVF
jgi:nucleolar complex protein 2